MVGEVRLQGYRRSVVALLPDPIDIDDLPASRMERLEPIGHWLPDMVDTNLDLGPLAALVEHVATRSEWSNIANDEDRNRMDAWTAPRLHAALRVPRRLAARQEFWTWIALEHAAPLVRARFGDQQGSVPSWRFTGGLLRNGVARLWWGAEMARDATDYGPVENVFGRTRTAQFALELGYSHYRAACIAFARVAEGADGGPRLSDQAMNTLSTSVNARLSLRVLEAADEGEPSVGKDVEWWGSSPSPAEVTGDAIPAGPDDGHASEASVAALQGWFRSLLHGGARVESSGHGGGPTADSGGEASPSVARGDSGSHGDTSGPASSSNPPTGVSVPVPSEGGTVALAAPTAIADPMEAPEPDSVHAAEHVDENARYVELPLPEAWRPILESFAPGRGPRLEPEAWSVERALTAFRTAVHAPRTRSVLARRFIGGRTLEEVGSVYGITRERVRQVQKKGLRRVKLALAETEPPADDLQRRLASVVDQPLVLRRSAKNLLAVDLLLDQSSDDRLQRFEIDGRLVVCHESFLEQVSEMEADVADRRELLHPESLAEHVGVAVEAVSVGVAMSDKLYYDPSGRVGTTGWSKAAMLEVVAWILALSDLEVASWHASELCEAAKVVFPEQFLDWRSRHAFAALSRTDVTAFVHSGRRGRWALTEAISGPSTTTAAIDELLQSIGAPLHFEEIMMHLHRSGREALRPTVAAILSRLQRFVEVGDGKWSHLDG